MKEVHRVRFEVVGILLSIFFILPFYWMAQTSTKDIGQLMQGTFFPGNPNHFIHDNIIDLFAWENGVFVHWLIYSFFYAGVGSVIGTVSSAASSSSS
jgi:multiple sugar transport system permease protein